MEFERGREHECKGRRRRVESLKPPARKWPVIDYRLPHYHTHARWAVNAATPHAAAGGIEILRVFHHQERFGFAVARLLFQIGFYGRAPVVPDEAGWTEPDAVTGLLQAPAHIHVISSLAINRIEAANVIERPFVEGHVAAGNVLGLAIVQHHVCRA